MYSVSLMSTLSPTSTLSSLSVNEIYNQKKGIYLLLSCHCLCLSFCYSHLEAMTEELTLEMTCSMTLSMEKQLTSCLFLTSSSQTKHVYNLFSGKFAYLAKDQIFI